MKTLAWVSDDGQDYGIEEHIGHAGLIAWWKTLPGIVGVMVLFEDGTRHSMEASEFYAVLPHGRERKRFWNGDCFACVPDGATVKLGIEMPNEVYEAASAEMMDA